MLEQNQYLKIQEVKIEQLSLHTPILLLIQLKFNTMNYSPFIQNSLQINKLLLWVAIKISNQSSLQQLFYIFNPFKGIKPLSKNFLLQVQDIYYIGKKLVPLQLIQQVPSSTSYFYPNNPSNVIPYDQDSVYNSTFQIININNLPIQMFLKK